MMTELGQRCLCRGEKKYIKESNLLQFTKSNERKSHKNLKLRQNKLHLQAKTKGRR